MGKITLSDVATRCGVSRATVSLVINDSSRVSELTKVRVRAALSEMNYVYDRRAANLRQQRTSTIGLLLTDVRNRALADLAMAIEDRADEAGNVVMMGYSDDSLDRQSRIMLNMIEHRLDGIVLSPARGTSPADLDVLVRVGVPHILVTRRSAGFMSGYVGPDNNAAGHLLGVHLASLGIRRVAFIGGSPSVSARQERMDGLRDGLRASGVPWLEQLHVASGAGRAGGIEGIGRLLAGGETPDAVVAYNDTVLGGVLAELRRRGIRAGGDVALAGFDNSPEAVDLDPPITTVDTFMGEVGREAVRRLLSTIDGKEDGHAIQLIAPRLHVRESTTSWVRKDR